MFHLFAKFWRIAIRLPKQTISVKVPGFAPVLTPFTTVRDSSITGWL